MEIVNQTREATSFFTTFPEVFHLFWFIVAFILNFILCRIISLKLVMEGYIKKYAVLMVVSNGGKSNEKFSKREKMRIISASQLNNDFKKLFMFWFVPIFGVCALFVLYIMCTSAKPIMKFKNSLFLSHI